MVIENVGLTENRRPFVLDRNGGVVMTDAHCHVTTGNSRHFVCDPCSGALGRGDVAFYGHHPWAFLGDAAKLREGWLEDLRQRLVGDPSAGVGEIGLDRLKERVVSDAMREAFDVQLKLALELGRPVVLHGAKCWGQVVAAVRKGVEAFGAGNPDSSVPGFLFHGFSRSGGLIPEIAALNGYISIGPAVLNDHAVNYRRLVAEIPADILLLETDYTGDGEKPSLDAIASAVASIRGVSVDGLVSLVESNATRFLYGNPPPL